MKELNPLLLIAMYIIYINVNEQSTPMNKRQASIITHSDSTTRQNESQRTEKDIPCKQQFKES